jgi:TRAP-type C4-dicarboxylate transport system substrate-binding protein
MEETRMQRSTVGTSLVFAVLAGAAVLAMPQGAVAQTVKEIRYSTGVPPKHVATVHGIEPWIQAVEKASSGRVKVRNFVGGQLVPLRASLSGVKDGVADGAIYVFTYYPAEYPIEKLISTIALGGEDPVALAAATTEFQVLECPDCVASYTAQNIVHTATYSTSAFRLISNRPIVTIEDVKGKKIRISGQALNKVFAAMGALTTTTGGEDQFQALSSGAMDATAQAVGALRSYSLWDAAKNVTDLPIGALPSISPGTFNRQFWMGLAAADRKAILETIPIAAVGSTIGYIVGDDEVAKEAAGKGVTIHRPSPQLKSKVAELLTEGIADAVAEAKAANVRDPEGKAKRYLELVAKWEKLVGGKHRLADVDEVVAIWNREITAKLVAANYGM